MKKILFGILLSTSLFAQIGIVESSKGIVLYCIDGYVFAGTSLSAPLVQMYTRSAGNSISLPRKCIFESKDK